MWENWLMNASKERTVSGNIIAPGFVQMIEWLSEGWNEMISNELIINSLKYCGNNS